METKFVRIAHGGEAHFVALYQGLNPQEGSRLLRAAFRLPQYVVGLMHEDSRCTGVSGVAVPMSLACRAPQMLEDRTYTLLLCDKEVDWAQGTTAAAAKGLATSLYADAVAGSLFGQHRESQQQQQQQQQQQEQEQQQQQRKPSGFLSGGRGGDMGEGMVMTEPATRRWIVKENGSVVSDHDLVEVDTTVKIVAFIRKMSDNGQLTDEERDALESAAVAGSEVVHTAFAVGVHSKDIDYLAALFKDIAAMRVDESRHGDRRLQETREMLDMAEALHQAQEISDGQRMHLQNLMIVGHESVKSPFAVYKHDHDVVRLAEALKHLCGAAGGMSQHSGMSPREVLGHGFVSTPTTAADHVGNPAEGVLGSRAHATTRHVASAPVVPAQSTTAAGGEGGRAGGGGGTAAAQMDGMKAVVLRAALNLANRGFLGTLEAKLLHEMVACGDDTLVAAYKEYQKDGDALKLHYAVGRAARVQANKHLRMMPVVASGSARPERLLFPATATCSDSLGGGMRRGGSRTTKVSDNIWSTRNDKREESTSNSGRGGEIGREGGRGLERLAGARAGGGDEDDGGGSEAGMCGVVPTGFQRLVWLAVQRKIVEVDDARILCAAFESGVTGDGGRLEDLVHAAWGLYEAKGDEEDALDSLARIVRLAVTPFKPDAVTAARSAPDAVTGLSPVRRAETSGAALRSKLMEAVRAIAAQAANVLVRSSKVTLEEASCLATPSAAGCAAILAELERFEGDSSRERLLDSLAAVAKQELQRRQSRQQQGQDGAHKVQESDDDGDDDNSDDDNDGDNEDDDDDDGNDDDDNDAGGKVRRVGGRSFRATQELMELVDCMAGDKRITREESLSLRALISRRHPSLVAAYQEYDKDQDVNLLVKSLLRIVRPKAAGNEPTQAGRLLPRGPVGNDLKPPHRAKVVLLMYETGVLEALEVAHVQLLLAQGDPEVMTAFDLFDSTKDISALVATLKTTIQAHLGGNRCSRSTATDASQGGSNSSTTAAGKSNGRTTPNEKNRNGSTKTNDKTADDDGLVDGNTEGVVESATRENAERENADGKQADGNNHTVRGNADGDSTGGIVNGIVRSDADDHLADSVVAIVDGMGLREDEAAALRLAMARGDANIRGALELYRVDGDGQELRDTLGRVARHVLEREATLQEVEEDAGDGADADVSGFAGAPDSGAGDPNSARVDGTDLTKPGREELFRSLLDQLKAMGMMGDEQARSIMARYLDKDAVVLAALDVYIHENDMSDLVDTLKRVT